MIEEEFEVVRGSGNIYADFGDPDADTKQIKAGLAAEIIAAMDRRKLGGQAGAELTGITTADLSRIRNAELARFTIDRLVRVLNNLDRHVELTVRNGGSRSAKDVAA